MQKAAQGSAPFDDGSDYSGIHTLFPMPFVTIHFVVRADTGIDDVRELKGETFIAGGTGNFCHQRSTAILEALGLSDAVDTPDMELSGAPAALRNEQAAGYVTCSSHPTPQLQELGTAVDLKLISFTPEQRETLPWGRGPVRSRSAQTPTNGSMSRSRRWASRWAARPSTWTTSPPG